MNSNKIHTPIGVKDILFDECIKKYYLKETISKIFNNYGFKFIESPTFEYFDVFAEERGNIQAKNMYRFFDNDGNIIVLRPDITPAIARIAATSLKEENDSLKICCIENTYRNLGNYTGKRIESTQAGVEYLGEDSSEVDAEIIALAIDCMKSGGLKDFKIEIGQASFLNSILEEANIDKQYIEKIKVLLDQKNFESLENFLNSIKIENYDKNLLLNLSSYNGNINILSKIRKELNGKKACGELDRLETIYEVLCDYGVEDCVSFDLGMVSRLNYYTGIIFRGYTYGASTSVIDGGRYNTLLSQFGKDLPAIGFGIMLDEYMAALDYQNINLIQKNKTTLVLYSNMTRGIAIKIMRYLRTKGVAVELGLLEKNIEENIKYAKRNCIGGILNFINNEDIDIYDVDNNSKITSKITDLMKEGES